MPQRSAFFRLILSAVTIALAIPAANLVDRIVNQTRPAYAEYVKQAEIKHKDEALVRELAYRADEPLTVKKRSPDSRAVFGAFDRLELEFNKPLDQSTVSTDRFRLVMDDGTTLPFTQVDYRRSKVTSHLREVLGEYEFLVIATLDPPLVAQRDLEFTVTVEGIRDAYGKTMTPASFAFKRYPSIEFDSF